MLFDINATQAAEIASEIGIPLLFDDDQEPIDTNPEDDENGGIIGGIIGKIKGWVAGAVGAVGRFIKGIFKGDWSLSSIIRKGAGWLVSSASFILNFNWNISPKQIEEQMKGSLMGLSSLLGEAIGGTFGWTACGVGASAVVGVINPAAAAVAMKAVNEEGMQEIMSYWGTFANACLRAGAQAAFLYGYASVRRLFLKAIGQDERLKQIESGKAKPWTINKALDDFIEKFEDSNNFMMKLFGSLLEGAKDEMFDACGEAFLIVADSFADALEAAGLAEERRNPPRLVEVSYRDD